MPRYYFHIKRGQLTLLDHEGAELVSLDEAAKEAVRRGRDAVAREAAHSAGLIIVADDDWQTVYEVRF